jgi:hypothetical protein
VHGDSLSVFQTIGSDVLRGEIKMKIAKARNILSAVLLGALALASASTAAEYGYPKKKLWYQESAAIQALRTPPAWNNMADFFAKELYNTDPLIGFNMESYINSPAGKGLIELLEPVILFKDEMGPDLLAYWKNKGITKTMAHADDAANRYAVYVPDTILQDRSGRLYPLMLLYSGGRDPIFTTEAFGVAAYGAKAGYITVAPTNRSPEAAIQIIEELSAKYPVDTSRVYGTGNGNGAFASFNVYAHNPKAFAAISPFGISLRLSSVTLTREELEHNFSGAGIQLPTQILDGALNSKRWHPLILRNEATQDYDPWLTINGAVFNSVTNPTGITLAVYSDDPAKRLTGINFNYTWKKSIEDEYYFGEFRDKNGVPVFRTGIASKASHWHSASYPQLIWEFCSMFSRDQKTGAMVYKPAGAGR